MKQYKSYRRNEVPGFEKLQIVKRRIWTNPLRVSQNDEPLKSENSFFQGFQQNINNLFGLNQPLQETSIDQPVLVEQTFVSSSRGTSEVASPSSSHETTNSFAARLDASRKQALVRARKTTRIVPVQSTETQIPQTAQSAETQTVSVKKRGRPRKQTETAQSAETETAQSAENPENETQNLLAQSAETQTLQFTQESSEVPSVTASILFDPISRTPQNQQPPNAGISLVEFSQKIKGKISQEVWKQVWSFEGLLDIENLKENNFENPQIFQEVFLTFRKKRICLHLPSGQFASGCPENIKEGRLSSPKTALLAKNGRPLFYTLQAVLKWDLEETINSFVLRTLVAALNAPFLFPNSEASKKCNFLPIKYTIFSQSKEGLLSEIWNVTQNNELRLLCVGDDLRKVQMYMYTFTIPTYREVVESEALQIIYKWLKKLYHEVPKEVDSVSFHLSFLKYFFTTQIISKATFLKNLPLGAYFQNVVAE